MLRSSVAFIRSGVPSIRSGMTSIRSVFLAPTMYMKRIQWCTWGLVRVTAAVSFHLPRATVLNSSPPRRCGQPLIHATKHSHRWWHSLLACGRTPQEGTPQRHPRAARQQRSCLKRTSKRDGRIIGPACVDETVRFGLFQYLLRCNEGRQSQFASTSSCEKRAQTRHMFAHGLHPTIDPIGTEITQ